MFTLELLRRIYAPDHMLKPSQKQEAHYDTAHFYKSYLKMAWPAVAESVLLGLVSVVDTVMVSTVGTKAVAAVGLTNQPRFLFQAVFIALSIGITAIVSRRKGENRQEDANKCLAQSLSLVLILGAVKLSQRVRFYMMAFGFTFMVIFSILTYFAVDFLIMCIFGFMAGLCNAFGNAVFNASLMLALPQKNRSAILGFVQSACTGGTALSAVIYGVLGDVFPLYLVFSVGTAICLVPMLYMSFHPRVKEFILNNG